MQRHLSIFLAGVIAISGAATSLAPAEAMPRVIPAVVADAASGGSIERVRNDNTSVMREIVKRNRGWNNCRRNDCWGGHGSHWRPRHHDRDWRYGYRDWDDGYDGGAAAAGIFGFAAGALVGSALSGGGYGSNYHAACSNKYRSYDPASGTYLGYDGYRHRCVLP